jgi:diadenosine tetraphosphate (Ap4A) HIT family hydrolase
MTSNICDFCDEFAGGQENVYSRLYGDELANRVLCRSEEFAVLPSLGQLAEGHLLIVPIKHYTATADLSSDLHEQFSCLVASVRRTLSHIYSPPVLFEHGVRGSSAGGCGVEHAHLHMVPFLSDNEPITELRREFAFEPINTLSDIGRRVPSKSPYLYYEQADGKRWVVGVDYAPSQRLRKAVATSLGTQWDWTKAGTQRSLLESVARLAPAFQQMQPQGDV